MSYLSQNELLLFLKIGDQPDNTGLKHGDPIAFIDTFGKPFLITDHTLTCFAVLILNRNLLPKIQQIFAPEYAIENEKENQYIARRKVILDFSQYTPKLNADWLSGMPVAPIDCTNFDLPDLFLTRAGNEPFVYDNNSIAGGVYTIGSGGDYATLSLFCADFAATLTSNLTGNIITGITETTEALISCNINGKTLIINNNNFGNGKHLQGSILTKSTDTTLLNLSPSGIGNIFINDLQIKNTFTTALNKYFFLNGGTFTGTILYKNPVLFCENERRGLYNSSHGNCKILNAKMYGKIQRGIFVEDTLGATYIENSFISQNGAAAGSGIRMNNAHQVTAQNNYIANFNLCFEGHAAHVGFNNASTDTTATNANWSVASGNLISKAALDNLKTIVHTDNDFGRLKKTSGLIRKGMIPVITENTKDICGKGRKANRCNIGIYENNPRGRYAVI